MFLMYRAANIGFAAGILHADSVASTTEVQREMERAAMDGSTNIIVHLYNLHLLTCSRFCGYVGWLLGGR
jgi:hypothetical protein